MIRVERYLNWSQGDSVSVQMDVDAVVSEENEDSFMLGGYTMSPKRSVSSLVWS